MWCTVHGTCTWQQDGACGVVLLVLTSECAAYGYALHSSTCTESLHRAHLLLQVHETHAQSEAKFHLVPYETGIYRFCLSLNQDRTGARYVLTRDVVWDLHVGHADLDSDHVKEHDTQSLWHYGKQCRCAWKVGHCHMVGGACSYHKGTGALGQQLKGLTCSAPSRIHVLCARGK